MQRFALSDARLAAALMAVGIPRAAFAIEPLHHTGTGEKRASWYVSGAHADSAGELLAEADPSHRTALWRSNPAHPFLAALAGVENCAWLERWLNAPLSTPHCHRAHGGPLCVLGAPGSEPDLIAALATLPPACALQSLPHVAAYIAAGFVPAPRLQQPGAVCFPAQSATFPGLTSERLYHAAVQMVEQPLQPPQLDGYPAGQHPFCYAFAAALNLADIPVREAAAWGNTVHFFPGVHQRCALATNEQLRRPGFEGKIEKHCSGLSID